MFLDAIVISNKKTEYMKRTQLINILILILLPCLAHSQTMLNEEKSDGKIKVWKMTHRGEYLGRAYSIDKNARIGVLFYPRPNEYKNMQLVVTGTYTSPDDSIAGPAFSNCHLIGGTDDPLFKPNAYLSFTKNGAMSFENNAECTSIPVYKVINRNEIQDNIIVERTSDSLLWRFLVSKTWSKIYSPDAVIPNQDRVSYGGEWIIVDMEVPLTLSEATRYVKALSRNDDYVDANNQGFTYTSVVSACLLDTGSYRPFLVNGRCIDGDKFPQKQSNVIVVN